MLSNVNRRLVNLFPTERFHQLLAIPLVAFTLAASLLAMVQPVSAQSNADSCATEGAVADPDNNPGLVADCEALLASSGCPGG